MIRIDASAFTDLEIGERQHQRHYENDMNKFMIHHCYNDWGNWQSSSNVSFGLLQHNFDYLFNEIQATKTNMDILKAENDALKAEVKKMKERLDEKLDKTNENLKTTHTNNEFVLNKTKICQDEMKVLKESLNHVSEIQNVNLDNYNRLLNFTEEMKETIPQLELRMNALVENNGINRDLIKND